jgi:NitT/TauT family transport system permease protein
VAPPVAAMGDTITRPAAGTAPERGSEAGTGPASASKRALPTWTRPSLWLPPLIAFGLLALGWQLYANSHPYVIPTLPDIFGELTRRPDFYYRNALVTLKETAVGAISAMVIAFVLAVIMCEVRVFERAVMPLAVMLNVTPIIAVAPGLVVAFGFGMTPKYIVVAIIVFFPFLINSLIGLRSVDPLVLDVLTTLHASRWETLWKLRLPSSLPFLCAAARICFPLSVIGAVVAEFSAPGNSNGLGTTIVTAASVSNLKTIYACVVVLSLLGILLTLLAVTLQRRLLVWHQTTPKRP